MRLFQCDDEDGSAVFINLDHVASVHFTPLCEYRGHTVSRLSFLLMNGRECLFFGKDAVRVKEELAILARHEAVARAASPQAERA